MGFTLRAVLDVLPSAAFVIVAELVPAVIQWNRDRSPPSPGIRSEIRALRIEVADVGFTLRANPGGFDAILLDVGTGPAAFTAGVSHNGTTGSDSQLVGYAA